MTNLQHPKIQEQTRKFAEDTRRSLFENQDQVVRYDIPSGYVTVQMIGSARGRATLVVTFFYDGDNLPPEAERMLKFLDERGLKYRSYISSNAMDGESE